MRRTSALLMRLASLWMLLLGPTVQSFLLQPSARLAPSLPGCWATARDDDNAGPEPSRMKDFIADFLQKKSKAAAAQEDDDNLASSVEDTDTDTYTHLVALPVDACHALMLELESIQRAILYHCPVLVHACLPAAVTRLPLLYVRTSSGTSAALAAARLFAMVEDLVQEHVWQAVAEDEVPAINDDDDALFVNEDGSRPLLLQFGALEMDGASNEVLQAVATVASSARLRTLVQALQSRIQQEEPGWTTALPPDPHQADTNEYRARIPFMRLPEPWNDYLEQPEADDDDDDNNFVFLPSDQGGNGISPIFWGKWVDDDLGTARMREVAVYQRSSRTGGLTEAAFYLPAHTLALPAAGDPAMTKQEAYYQDYQEQRMMEAEAIQANQGSTGDQTEENSEISVDDHLLKLTKERLEDLYQRDTSASEANTLEDDPAEEILQEGRLERPVDLDVIDDWTRDRIQGIIASRAKVQSEKELSRPKEKPPISENEVFRKYKEGTLVPKSKDPPTPAPVLPPFPSRQHCVGFWKILQSPTGFAVEETDFRQTDNLVLRVDGTTAGGPILDPVARQKAAGGTWRLNDDELRIRLIIPPGKDRILVMQGKLQKVSMESEIQLAPSTFGIPALEERQARSSAELEDVFYCNGDVWVEDAITKKNRSDVGTFSLTKLNTPTDPKEFTITIPQPVRNQD
jgi:hypothetical protein